MEAEHHYRIYTDGGCDGNGAKGEWGTAAYGAHVERLTADGEPEAAADLWGPVVVDSASLWYLGAEKGTNNTGELCGVIQALLWLLHVASGTEGAVILCDSCYSMDMLDERATPRTNVALILLGKNLLVQVRQQRAVKFVHVKGHSGDPGNDRADELVQWGKHDSDEYARFRVDGTGEGASRVGPVEDYETVRDARQRAAEEAKTAREQEAVAARERRRRLRMAIGQAAVDETATSASVSVRDRAEWDSSLVLGIVSHNLAVN